MSNKKAISFPGKEVDPEQLAGKIQDLLKSDGFTVEATGDSTKGFVIQAKKGGFMANLISAERALVISVSSGPEVTVEIGIGNWRKDLLITAVETLFISDLFLPVDLGEMAWNVEIENKLAKQIAALV
jgi:hypothetical protein